MSDDGNDGGVASRPKYRETTAASGDPRPPSTDLLGVPDDPDVLRFGRAGPYRGRGDAVPILLLMYPVVAFAAGLVAIEKWPAFSEEIKGFSSSVGLVVGASFCIYYGREWNRTRKQRTKHSWFFVPVETWGVLALLIAGILVVKTGGDLYVAATRQ